MLEDYSGQVDLEIEDNDIELDQRYVYWANKPADEIANEILDKKDNYFEFLMVSGRRDLYQKSRDAYYAPRLVGAQLNAAGEQGELTTFNINHQRNLLMHLENMTTQQRPAFEPIATNSDTSSQSQVILAAGLLDYNMRENDLESGVKTAVKEALIFAEAFIVPLWNPYLGETFGTDSRGRDKKVGDIEYRNYTPLTCVRDWTRLKPGRDDYFILIDLENKWELAAKFPHLKKDILDNEDDINELQKFILTEMIDVEECDNSAVYTLVHKPTLSVPQGRFTTCLSNGTVMLDGPLPYRQAHIYRLAPDEETGTIFGYTVAYDLLPVQEAIDLLYSAAISNNVAFAVQNLLVPKGHDTSVTQLSGGLNLVEYDPKVGKPEPLNLLQTPPEVYKFIEMLEHLSETISAVNSVARGNPEASLKSGAALALVQSQAVQASMTFIQNYNKFMEKIGSGTIEIYQDYASAPRVAEIVGKDNQPLMKNFSSQDLIDIKRVSVSMGNPMTKTIAGRTNLAEMYLQNNMIENPDQFQQVVTTGRFDQIIKGKQMQLLLIKSENEKLAEAVPQRAIWTDNHIKHLLEHTIVCSNTNIRANPNDPVLIETFTHMQEHIDFLSQPHVQTFMTAIYGEDVSIFMQQMMPQIQGMMGQAGAPGANAAGGTSDMLGANLPIVEEAQDIQGPGMPNPPKGTDARSADIIESA